MYVNTTAEVKAETDYCCTSSNAVEVVEHISREHGDDTEILFGPDMFLGAYVEKETRAQDARLDRRVPRARRHPPGRHRERPRRAPGRRLPDPPRVRLLDVGHGVRGRRRRRRREHPHALDRRDARPRQARPTPTRSSSPPRPACCTRWSEANPGKTFVPANRAAVCQYMKMITLPKLRDALRDGGERYTREGRPRDRRARAGADRAHGGDQPVDAQGTAARPSPLRSAVVAPGAT